MNDAINTSSLVPFSENEAQLRRLAEADDATGFDELLKQTGQFDYGDAQRIIDDPDIYIHFRKDLAKRMASMSFEQYWKITHDEEKDHLIRGTHRVFRSSPPDSLTNILRGKVMQNEGYDELRGYMRDDGIFCECIGSHTSIERTDILYGAAYERELLDAPGGCHMDRCESIVQDALGQCRLLKVPDEQREKNQRKLNQKQFDRVKDVAEKFGIELELTGRTLVIYGRYGQGACPLCAYLMKEAMKHVIPDYSYFFSDILVVQRHQEISLPIDYVSDPRVIAGNGIENDDFDVATQMYANTVHSIDATVYPKGGERFCDEKNPHIAGLSTATNPDRKEGAKGCVVMNNFWCGGENRGLSNYFRWRDTQKNKAGTLRGMLVEFIRSFQELEVELIKQISGPVEDVVKTANQAATDAGSNSNNGTVRIRLG